MEIPLNRHITPLPRRHILLCWPGTEEALDEVSRDQDVPGEAEAGARPCAAPGVGAVQGPGRPHHGLHWD